MNRITEAGEILAKAIDPSGDLWWAENAADDVLNLIRDAIYREGEDADTIREALGLTAEWTVRHAQGIHPGPFTEERAREWIADDVKRDKGRQFSVQGKQRLLRRLVSDWQEVTSAS